MAPDGIMEPVDVSGTAFLACWRVCQATGQISSALMVLKNVSIIALSWQLPLPLIEIRKRRRRSTAWSSTEQYWLPLSLW